MYNSYYVCSSILSSHLLNWKLLQPSHNLASILLTLLMLILQLELHPVIRNIFYGQFRNLNLYALLQELYINSLHACYLFSQDP